MPNYESYTLLYNSKKNSRGVGILINNSLGFAVSEQRSDANDNWLIIKGTMSGNNFILGAIYGPNNHDANFFFTAKNCHNIIGKLPRNSGGGLELYV